MKKERIETIVDSFIDKNGKERHFVIAAISTVLPTNSKELFPDDEESECEFNVYYEDDSDSTLIDNVVKILKIGYSICNPNDEFNEELGKTIAIGRARKNVNTALYSTELGYINSGVVKALLEEKARWFKENPERWITNYWNRK